MLTKNVCLLANQGCLLTVGGVRAVLDEVEYGLLVGRVRWIVAHTIIKFDSIKLTKRFFRKKSKMHKMVHDH